MEIFAQTSQDTSELATSIALKLLPNDVIALSGDLGSGKTFFTSALVNALNIKSRVQSPTFVLVREYENLGLDQPIKKVYHIDLYRLDNVDEAIDLGIESFFKDPTAITIIEWPEIIKDILPKDTIFINFKSIDENKRRIDVQNFNR